MTNLSPADWLETAQGRLAIRRDGPDGGVPLVLLQRFRGTMDDWDPDFIAAISTDRRVIRFDSAGIGRSGGRVPETIPGMAAAAAEVIRGLGLVQADVLGWSLGGTVAQQLALDAPQLVRRLIVAGSSPDAKLVLYPDAGHAFLFQEIEDFAAEIDRFLA